MILPNPLPSLECLDELSPEQLGKLLTLSVPGSMNVARFQAVVQAGADLDLRDNFLNGQTALISAAYSGYLEYVKILITAGAFIDAMDHYQSTALYYAAQNGHTSTVQALLSAGATIDIKNQWDWTPLHGAVNNSHLEIIHLLINAGASKDVKEYLGNTPWDLAGLNIRHHCPELKP